MSLSETQLMAQAASIRAKLATIEKARKTEENSKLVGKCFKCRNSYGGGDRKGWWLYAMVVEATDSLLVNMFQKTELVEFIARPAEYRMNMNGYTPISRKQYDAAWEKFTRELNAINAQ